MISVTKIQMEMLKSSRILNRIIWLLVLFMLWGNYQFFLSIKENAKSELSREFFCVTQELQTAIQERVLGYEKILYATRALLYSSSHLNAEQFNTYADALYTEGYFTGVEELGYIAILPKRERGVSSSFDSDYMQQQTIETSLLYLKSFGLKSQRTLGDDLYLDTKKRLAMQSSRDKGVATLSENTELSFLYLPLFKKGVNLGSSYERRENIIGWVYMALDIKKFLHGLKDEMRGKIEVEIYDDTQLDGYSLIYKSDKILSSPLLEREFGCNVAGREWSVVAQSSPYFDSKLDVSVAWIVLILGTLFSLLIPYIIFKLLKNSEQREIESIEMSRALSISKYEYHDLSTTLELKVREKTQELQSSNEILEEYVGVLNTLNAKLLSAKEEAMQAAQAKSNFISAISHELRTPLNSIINFTDQVLEDFDEMLEDRELQEETQMFLGRVMVNSRHLLELINDLLEFTKAEAGKMEYSMEEVDINSILLSAYNNSHSLLNGTDIEFRFAPSTQRLLAKVDARRFLQILLNLLSNAIKFTQSGHIQLRSFLDRGHIVVEIEDTGKGIPLDRQESIFEPFIQVNSTDAGTGLGLGLVKKMCDSMNIEITLRSVEGEGSLFRLQLETIEALGISKS